MAALECLSQALGVLNCDLALRVGESTIASIKEP